MRVYARNVFNNTVPNKCIDADSVVTQGIGGTAQSDGYLSIITTYDNSYMLIIIWLFKPNKAMLYWVVTFKLGASSQVPFDHVLIVNGYNLWID